MTDDPQTVAGDTGAGPDTSGYLNYLLTNRDFTASAVASAVKSLAPKLPPGRGARVLDAGTGAGGALPELVALARSDPNRAGAVMAIDIDARAVETAKVQLGEAGLADAPVEFRVADLREIADEAASTGKRFDVIWSADVVWPATFDDPGAVAAALAGCLTPGGTLALFTTNYYQSMLLPGHSRLERLIRTASEATWGLPDDGPTQYERLGAWLREAELIEVELRVFPVAAMASEPAARAFLAQIVWPEMRHAVASNGRSVGMSESDVARAEELLNPASPDWIGADPDAFVVQPTLLWTGCTPS